MIEIASVSAGADHDAARASLFSILDATPLCTIATCDAAAMPAAATAFYVVDHEDVVIYVLTGPDTVHGRNIRSSGRAALSVFSSTQEWTDAKRGVQLSAAAGLTKADDVERVLELYLKSYPGLGKWVQSAGDIDKKLESRFFSFAVDRCKIFDEPNFGTEVWIEVEFARP